MRPQAIKPAAIPACTRIITTTTTTSDQATINDGTRSSLHTYSPNRDIDIDIDIFPFSPPQSLPTPITSSAPACPWDYRPTTPPHNLWAHEDQIAAHGDVAAHARRMIAHDKKAAAARCRERRRELEEEGKVWRIVAVEGGEEGWEGPEGWPEWLGMGTEIGWECEGWNRMVERAGWFDEWFRRDVGWFELLWWWNEAGRELRRR